FPILSAACLFYAVSKIATNNTYQNFIIPYSLPQPPVKAVTIDHLKLSIPEKIFNNWNARCYGTDLPCLYRVNPALRARGEHIKDGFRLDTNAIVPFSTIEEWN